jgi:putative flippase GtrA
MLSRDAKFAVVAGLMTGILLLPIMTNLGFLDFYKGIAAIVFVPIIWLVGMKVVESLTARFLWLYQFAKFIVTGFMNTTLDMGILNLLSYTTGIYSGKEILVLNSISFAVAVTNSFFWNKYWTFASGDVTKATEYMRFLGVSLIGLILSGGIVFVVTTYVPTASLTPAMVENIAKVLATSIVLFWNFAGFKFLVFRK